MGILSSHFHRLVTGLSRLSRYEWAFAGGMLVPLGCLHLILKAKRIDRFIKIENPFQFIDIYSSDILVYLTLLFAGLTLFMLVKLDAKRFVLVALQVFMLIFTFIEVSSHNYFMITGFSLDYQLLKYTIQNFNELTSVMGSESDSSNLGILATAIAIVAFLPWLTVYSVKLLYPIASNAGEKQDRVLPLYTLGIAVFLVVCQLVPALFRAAPGSTQNLVYLVVESMFRTNAVGQGPESEKLRPVTDSKLLKRAYSRSKNLVFIIFESTRAGVTSLEKPSLGTTPFLKEMAQKSLVARNAYAHVSRTSKSLVPIHCSIEPRPSMQILEAEENGIPAKCLPALLAEQGYDTAYFQTAWEFFENRPELVKNMGFKEFYPGDDLPKEGFQETNYFGFEDKILLKPSREWLQKRAGGRKKNPFMVTYLTNTPHHQYIVPYRHKRQPYSEVEDFNRYLNTINYTDSVVRDLVQQYIDLGLYQDTIFVIMADHGEAFWEHDYFGHSNVVYNECMHIPLLIHDPQRFKHGREIERPINQADIMPTVVDMLGYRIANNGYRGVNMLKPRKDYKLFMDCWHERKCAGYVDDGHYKYIHHFEEKPDEVFNMKSDPLEKKNIISEFSQDQVRAMKQNTLDWYKSIENLYSRWDKEKPVAQ